MIIVIPDWSSVSQRCVRRRPYSSSRLFGLIKFLKQGTKEDQMMIGLLTNVWLQKNRTLFTIQLIVFWGNILTMLPNQKIAEELSSLLFSILFLSPFQESLALAKKRLHPSHMSRRAPGNIYKGIHDLSGNFFLLFCRSTYFWEFSQKSVYSRMH